MRRDSDSLRAVADKWRVQAQTLQQQLTATGKKCDVDVNTLARAHQEQIIALIEHNQALVAEQNKLVQSVPLEMRRTEQV